MRRVFRFLVVLTLCWALLPAAVAHAQDDSNDCVVDVEALWEYFQSPSPGFRGSLPSGCTTVRIDYPETYYVPDGGGSVTLPDGTTVTSDADGRVTLPDGTTGTIVVPKSPKTVIIDEGADGPTGPTVAPTLPTRLIIDGVPYSP